jgi:arylsulfatase A-like enzyme
MKRRDFLKSAGALAAGFAFPLATANELKNGAVRTDSRPNFVFIFADDLGYGDLGCYGHPYARTPHLDKLASEGTLFKHAYVTGATCCPSRTGVMTGRYPARFERYMADYGFGDRVTVTELLRDAGYRTGHVGKWHMGPTTKPGVYGLDWTPQSSSVAGGNKHASERGRDAYVFDQALEFLEQLDDKPFYLNVWGHISHFPVNPHERFVKRFEDITVDESLFSAPMREKFDQCRELGGDVTESMRRYLGDVSSLDDDVGRLLRKLDELGLRDNTIVVFASDQGPAPVISKALKGSKQDNRSPERRAYARNMLGSMQPFRGGKHMFLEGGVHTPFIIRWPEKVPAGRVNETSVISMIDWLATISKLAGIENIPDDLDGEDVSDIWLGATRTRRTPLFWRLSNKYAATVVRDGDWKYVEPRNRRIPGELYDVSKDIMEADNVADKHPDIVKRFERMVAAFEAELPTEYVRGNPDRRKTANTEQ